jgi:hypothetical protein
MQNEKYSFFYSLADRDLHTWAPGAVNPTDNLIGIGIAVAQGERREITTQMDYDADYELQGLALQAYWWDSVNGQYWWYEPQTGLDLTGPEQTEIIGTPLVNFLRIRLRVLSPRKQYIIGSQEQDQHINGDTHRLNPRGVQGNEDGKTPFKMEPHLVERGGILSLTVENVHTVKDLVVSGTYHGIKMCPKG